MKQWHKNRSFVDACKLAMVGVREAYARETNIRRQVKVFIAVTIVSILLKVSLLEFALIVLASGLVISLELINSALEEVEDIIWPEYRDAIKRSKDIAAGAVLVASLTAVVVGTVILFPPLAKLLLLLY